ncbi:hypothetical protein ACW5EG_02335 [Luteimonas sp. A611]
MQGRAALPRVREGGVGGAAWHVARRGWICLVLLPVAAFAQVRQTGEYLAKMDADGDGRVSLSEYQAWMSYAFDGMDRNGDGVLDAGEQPGGKGAPLSRGQHLARLAERFGKQDVDRDGFLDARELAAPPR